MQKHSVNISDYLLHSESLSAEEVDRLRCIKCNELRIPLYLHEASGCRICSPCLTQHEDCDGLSVQQVRVDVATEAGIRNLVIRCPFINNGCQETGPVHHILDTHFDQCLYNPKVCPFHYTEAAADIHEHQGSDCHFCIRKMETPDSQHHTRNENGGDESTNQPHCEFAEIGCQLLAANDDLKTHYKENICNHLQLLFEKFESDTTETRAIQEEVTIFFSRADFLASNVFNMRALQHLRDTIKKRLQETGRLPQILLSDSAGSSAAVETSSEHLLRIKSQHEQLTASLNRSGKLLWVFTDFKRKQRSGTFFDSETFYTDSMGYRLRIRCYPKGNGRAMGQFFSLYFAIVHGEYDALLEWPMKLNVTLEILACNDSSGALGSRSKRQTYCMGVDQEPFKKPLPNEVNIAVGNPRFLPLVELANYVKNDKLFIQCRVARP